MANIEIGIRLFLEEFDIQQKFFEFCDFFTYLLYLRKLAFETNISIKY